MRSKLLAVFLIGTLAVTTFASPAFTQLVPVQLVPTPAAPITAAEPEASSIREAFQLRRETKLAGLRVAIKNRAAKATRAERRIFNRVLADPDMLELTLAHVEWLESQEGVAALEDGERKPIQDFLQFVIDNWDSIKQIIEFVSGLFGDVPL